MTVLLLFVCTLFAFLYLFSFLSLFFVFFFSFFLADRVRPRSPGPDLEF